MSTANAMKWRPTVVLAIVGLALSSGAAGYRWGAARAGRAPAADALIATARYGFNATRPERRAGAESLTLDEDFDQAWRRISTIPGGPAAKNQRALALERLAHRDPLRAIAIARADANWAWRGELRDAVLRAWAQDAPEAAAEWALARNGDERSDSLIAVLHGTATPEVAVALAQRGCESDPAHAAGIGGALIAVLAEKGEFSRAAQFVAAQPASPLRLEQQEAAFTAWAQNRPAEAADAARAITDADLNTAARHGVAVGWAQADPIGAANYAAGLPPGDARAELLANAIPRWVDHDPVAAAAWLEEHDSNADFDMGIVAVAGVPALVHNRPELALTLAGSIADAPLRTNTLRNLALQWAESDAAAAKSYVQTSGRFSAEEQHTLLAEIGAKP